MCNILLIIALTLYLQAVHKHDSKEYVIAKKYAMTSIILTVIFVTTFPLLVAVTVISSVFGGTCQPSSFGSRPTYCPGWALSLSCQGTIVCWIMHIHSHAFIPTAPEDYNFGIAL